MRPIAIDDIIHAAIERGPRSRQYRGPNGDTDVAAHVLACDPERYAGTLDVYVSPFDPDGDEPTCAECIRVAGPEARALIERREMRRLGIPLTMFELFQQGTWWKTGDGRWLKIAEMDADHVRNLRRWLVRNAATLAMRSELSSFLSMPDPENVGDMALLALEQDNNIRQARAHQDPGGYIRATKLYRALETRTA